MAKLKLLLLFLLILSAAIVPTAVAAQEPTLAELIDADPDLQTFENLLRQDGVVWGLLQNSRTYTVFAPTNAAFERLPAGTLEQLQQDPVLRRQTLLNHLAIGRYRPPRLIETASLRTALGNDLALAVTGSQSMRINDRVNVLLTGTPGENGRLYKVDAVIAPVLGLFNQPLPKPSDPNPIAAPKPEVGPGQSLLNLIMSDGRFSTFYGFVQQTDLENLLLQHGPFTVFIPTNEAFAALDAATMAQLRSNNTLLRQTLIYHILRGERMAASLGSLGSVNTALGKPVTIATDGGQIAVNGSARVIDSDIDATNGVIHVVNTVLLQPDGRFAAPQPRPASDAGLVLDILAADGRFSTLLSAISTAGMENAFIRQGGFTLFAPTDEAFEDLPDGTLEFLLSNRRLLQNRLRYHIVDRPVAIDELRGTASLPTRHGPQLYVDGSDGTRIVINGTALIISGQINTRNGIVYILDTVLTDPPLP